MEKSPPSSILEAQDVSKVYGGVQALDNVSLSLQSGEILAVVGENGAGKSTLMKILAGVVQPSSGTILIEGKPTRLADVTQALDCGIALIHQELNLAPNLDVGANICLGREPSKFGFVDRKSVTGRAQLHLARLGLHLPPSTRLDSLSIGMQQLVEIAKALSVDAKILILDEPTSSLSQQEAEQLFVVLRQLRSKGVGICYISHRLNEVTDLADRVVVLRDGKCVGELSHSEIDRERIVQMMVGRDISQFYQRKPHTAGAKAIDVKSLRTARYPNVALDFAVRAGEIVGLAGLVGAGRTELLTTLFGITPQVDGEIFLEGESYSPKNASDAISSGVVLAPEDRRLSGLHLQKGVRWNLSLASLSQALSRCGFIRRQAETELCKKVISDYGIKTAGLESQVGHMSGGNQQKVVLGKWLAREPRLLLLDEPTRGIDVGSKSEIYGLMHDLAGKGVAILFASSDMEEIVGLSDRVLVMHQGQIAGELKREDFNEEAIMRLAVGSSTKQLAAESA
ncbi:sugar ABC transporter ATP-binding protein [Bythopirellula goksoeyrii]|uniref:Arabinose import ATP-binding protein AraG n=1 Tax=Bythopirellula goksoeyrii TaxID=1400387 RepID=A0A5B9Q4S7_9BACT|nr:sugar ABC transporter ATP-binding protein [Bythopirellula goksoeyrii]QEG32750.1 Arabinose import ATP-binding protein AraG [Bythopirellula goksoeyrii]